MTTPVSLPGPVSSQRLSVPTPRRQLPRPLTDTELGTCSRLADLLCGPSDLAAPPSAHPEFPRLLELALATRADSFEALTAALAEAAQSAAPEQWLRQLHAEDPVTFQALSTVLGGAYLLVPAVREAVAYPGQRRDPAGLEEAVDEIGDGILDPVLDRGPFYVDPATGARADVGS